MSDGENKSYDVTHPHVQTGSNGQAFSLRFDQLERRPNGPQPNGRYVLLTMTRAEAATLAEQLHAGLHPQAPDPKLN
jgi:hypothetical protein